MSKRGREGRAEGRRRGGAGDAPAPPRPALFDAGGVGRALAIAAIGATALLLAAASFRRIWASDFWWQLATGRLVGASGPPRTDVFSYTAAGEPWIELRWLYCWILAASVRLGGFAAPVVLKWIVLCGAFALAAAAAVTRRTAIVACAAVSLAIVVSSQRFFVRPELATYLFFAAFLWILAWERAKESRLLFALPALQVLWANTHTTFLLGPFLVGLMLLVSLAGLARTGRSSPEGREAAIRKVRRATIVLGVTIVAVFLTPYGVRGVLFSLNLFSEIRNPVFQDVSAELRSPFSFSQSYTAVVYYEVLIGVCLLAGAIAGTRLDPFFALVLLSQLYLSVTSIRNLPLFGFAAVPFIVSCFERISLGRWRPAARARPALERLAAAAVVVFALVLCWAFATDRFNVWQGDTNQFGAGVAAHRYPERAAVFLRERMPGGTSVRLFNTMLEGSYLLAHGYQVFIDPRLEVHGEDRLARYTRMASDEKAWKAASEEFGFQAAVVDILSPYLRNLVGSHEWDLVDFDEAAAVFARRGLADAPPPIVTRADFAAALARLRASLPSPSGSAGRSLFSRVESPSPYLRVAVFLVKFGQSEEAEPFVADALAAWPKAEGAHGTLAQIHEARGEIASAIREYEAEHAVAPDEPFINRQLGLLYFKSGRREEARARLERAVASVPGDALGWAALTKLHTDANRLQDAIACARRAVDAAPGVADYLENLGRLLAVTGNKREAVAVLSRAVALDPADRTVLRDLAVLAYQLGEMDQALAYADRALALAPNDPELATVRRTILEKVRASRSGSPPPARP